ncbi:MAG: ferrous iron transport protein B [Oscillospiraceae bacterium]
MSLAENLPDTLFRIKKNSPDDKIIALAGNPNVGKSTVFNALTGLNQHTGNWSGKTVSNAQGYYKHNNQGYVMVDIPGCYSLNSHSAEEEVARDFICFGNADCIVTVCDASCLERNLCLLMQILCVSDNVILCVNLIDEAEKHGVSVDYGKLSDTLGIPVIPMTARSGKGLDKLTEVIHSHKKSTGVFKIKYPTEIQSAIDMLIPALHRYCRNNIPAEWLAVKLLENDVSFISSFNMHYGINLSYDNNLKNCLNNAYDFLENSGISKIQLCDEIAASYVSAAEDIFHKTVKVSADDRYRQRDRKIDKFLTGKFTGFLSMILMLAMVFWITIAGANYPSAFLQKTLFSIEQPFHDMLVSVNIPSSICDMLAYGVYRVLAWIVSVMLPPMAIFFPLFAILEDLGYLPRIAFNLDKCFKSCKSCGKQCLTMAMGLGCNASGVVGCRIIDSPRERLIAIITNSFVPCNGRFPMIMALITMYIAGSSGSGILSALILTLVIMLGIGMTFINSRILSATLLKGTPTSFTLELPPYRRPQIIKVIVRSMLDRVIFVLGRAMISAIPAGVIIWLAANIQTGTDTTLLMSITEFLNPFAEFIGLDGVILTAFILGMPANEIVIPIMIMAYTANGTLVEINDITALKEIFSANGWDMTTAVCTIVFSLFHFPCMTTLMTIKKETGSVKWTVLSFILPLINGVLLCALINNVSNLFI